jgi:hypothetical protein
LAIPPSFRSPFGRDKGPSKSDREGVMAKDAPVSKMMGWTSVGVSQSDRKAAGSKSEPEDSAVEYAAGTQQSTKHDDESEEAAEKSNMVLKVGLIKGKGVGGGRRGGPKKDKGTSTEAHQAP